MRASSIPFTTISCMGDLFSMFKRRNSTYSLTLSFIHTARSYTQSHRIFTVKDGATMNFWCVNRVACVCVLESKCMCVVYAVNMLMLLVLLSCMTFRSSFSVVVCVCTCESARVYVCILESHEKYARDTHKYST